MMLIQNVHMLFNIAIMLSTPAIRFSVSGVKWSSVKCPRSVVLSRHKGYFMSDSWRLSMSRHVIESTDRHNNLVPTQCHQETILYLLSHSCVWRSGWVPDTDAAVFLVYTCFVPVGFQLYTPEWAVSCSVLFTSQYPSGSSFTWPLSDVWTNQRPALNFSLISHRLCAREQTLTLLLSFYLLTYWCSFMFITVFLTSVTLVYTLQDAGQVNHFARTDKNHGACSQVGTWWITWLESSMTFERFRCLLELPSLLRGK